MFRNAEEKDFALYMELAQEFYHSPAVMHPIPAQYMENTFREAMPLGRVHHSPHY